MLASRLLFLSYTWVQKKNLFMQIDEKWIRTPVTKIGKNINSEVLTYIFIIARCTFM